MLSRPVTIAALLAGLAMGAVAVAFPRDFHVGNFVDDAHYAVLAKSIRTGAGYRTINLPDSLPETKYPPAWPAVLAVAWSPEQSDGDNLDRLRWVNLVLVGPLAALLTLLAVRVGMSAWLGALVAIAGLLSTRTAALWTIPMSGPLFLLCVAGGLLAHLHGRDRLALGLLLVAVYVRTVAAGFVIGLIVARALSGDARWKRDAAVAALAVAPWLVWQAVNSGAVPDSLLGIYGSYGRWYLASLAADPVTVLLRVPWKNLLFVLNEFGLNLVGRGWLPGLVAIGVGITFAWAVVRGARRDLVLSVGLAAYGMLVLLWPFPPDRFVAGAWPLVLLVGIGALGRRTAWGVLGAALAVAVIAALRAEPLRFHRSRSAMAAEIEERIRPALAQDGVLVSTNPGAHHLRLGVATVPGQRMRSYRFYRLGYWSTAWGLGDDLWPILERYRPRHLVVEIRGVEGRYAAGSLIAQCPGVLPPIWETPAGALFFEVDVRMPCEPRPSER